MSSNESIFERLDNYLENKKSSEISLMLLMIFLFVAFVVYSYVFPITERKLKITRQNLNNVSKKLKAEKDYLRSVSKNGDERYMIKKIQKEIDTQKKLYVKISHANKYVDGKLKELSYLLFNNKNWAKFLDSITYMAKKYRVKIKVLESNIEKPDMQKIKQILTVKVEFSGNFKNVMKFINSIEESKLVVDVNEIKLVSGPKLKGYLNIAVWGMKY